MLIYVHRSLVFSSDPSMMDKDRMVRVDAKPGPQEVPNWITDTETFRLALQAHYIEIIADVPPDQADKIAALSRKLAPSHVAPLAAETRPLRTYHPGSGLGVLAKF